MATVAQNAFIRIQTNLSLEHCLDALRRGLRKEGFQVVEESRLDGEPAQAAASDRGGCAVLVAWNAFFAYQALLSAPNAGLVMPFSIAVVEDVTGCWVVVFNYNLLTGATQPLGVRVLARVLAQKIRQVLLHVGLQGATQRAVAAGGGVYRGIQQGSVEKNIPDLVLFDDPVTETTLALPMNGQPITAEAVRARIAESRASFRQAQDGQAEHGRPGIPVSVAHRSCAV